MTPGSKNRIAVDRTSILFMMVASIATHWELVQLEARCGRRSILFAKRYGSQTAMCKRKWPPSLTSILFGHMTIDGQCLPLENLRLTSGQNSFRTFDAISTPICMPSFVAELVALRLS